MCGIAGIFPAARDPSDGGSRKLEAQLGQLREALCHRGPDAQGQIVAGGVGLAHTRLAILDLSASGAQPMWSPDHRFAIAYNGEIYNFATLREELEARGECFRGRSDTEVVLRLLCLQGPAALSRLDGMFALAWLDVRKREVLLARDRSGQKPLYVAELQGGGWAFASEIRPLLELPAVDARLCPQGLSHLLSFGVLPAPFTLRRGVRQLETGCFLRLPVGGSAQAGRFAQPPGPVATARGGEIEALSYQLEETLSDSVRRHLVADVPVGVLLSGGVDSSTIAALAARHVPRLKTFAVVHRDPAYDEREAARAVASALGTEHCEVEFSEDPLSEDELDLLVDHHGDPFADSSSLAVQRLSREMRKHVTVALSGDGADEVFAGYPRFGELRLLSSLARLPRPLLAGIAAASGGLPGNRARQVARAFHVAAMPRARRAVAFTTLFWPEEQRRLLRPEWCPEGATGLMEQLLEDRGAGACEDPIEAAHWLEQRLVLPDDMLTKVDRMSMSVALEVRPPFLANGVLDFARAIPFEAKHRGRQGKRVLKTLARRLVPPWVVDRPKRGFAVPLEVHGGRVFEEASRFALDSEASPLRELFRPEALAALSRELQPNAATKGAEDSAFRRVHRRWLLALLARALVRHGMG